MISTAAQEEVEAFLLRKRQSFDALTPAEGVSAMLDFYRSVRAEDCDLESDGDMLLYQWGTYGDEARFEVDITRQFIPDDDEGAIWQLSLTFKFEPDEELAELGSGNEWCHHPDESAEFLATEMLGSEAYVAVADRRDGEVELDFQDVE